LPAAEHDPGALLERQRATPAYRRAAQLDVFEETM
jgi:hypothetical protein